VRAEPAEERLKMKIRLALATATAMGLLMGAATAGSNNTAVIVQGLGGSDNTATVDQDGGNSNTTKFIQNGSGNTAEVTQDGNNNRAGTHLEYGAPSQDPGDAARGYNFITQNGSNNKLKIDQTARGNSVAVDGKVVQTGDGNAIDITQKGGASGGNRVDTVLQSGIAGAAATNKLTVLQEGAAPNSYSDIPLGSSDYNYANERITKVEQINEGGLVNTLTLTQKGGVHNAGNTIVSAYQRGSDNSGSVTQTGRGNRLQSLSQNGVGNEATVSVTGDNNGAAGLGQLIDDFALGAAGGYDRSIVQNGLDNVVDFEVLGNSNQFGFNQFGEGNTSGNVSLNGSFNEVGVNQTGNDNKVDLGTIIGNRNDVGIRQTGNDNLATIDILDTLGADSDDNAVSIEQHSVLAAGYDRRNEATVSVDGDGNWLRFKQVYGSNATADVTGDNNDIAVDQYSSATADITVTGNNNAAALNQLHGATATVSINGDNNNRGAFAGAITSALASSTSSALGAPMQVGGIIQKGASSVSLTVGQLGPSDGNRFSLNQSGNGNSIVGSMDGSAGGNEAVISQVGTSNTTSFAQNGGFNTLAVTQ
jgi:hypothetical protein